MIAIPLVHKDPQAVSPSVIGITESCGQDGLVC